MKSAIKLITACVMLAGSAAPALAHAQWWKERHWGGQAWGRPGSVYAPGERDRILVERTCNGLFVQLIGNRIAQERRMGGLRWTTADRMGRDIHRLDQRGRIACRYRDWRTARDVGDSFMVISHAIDRQTHRFTRW